MNGEAFTYLGRNYRLKCPSGDAGEVKLKNGYLTVPLEGMSQGVNLKGLVIIGNMFRVWSLTTKNAENG